MSVSKEKTEKNSTATGSCENVSSITIDKENSDDLNLLDVDLLHRMDMEDIEELKMFFFDNDRIEGSDSKAKAQNRVHGLRLTKEEFVEALEKLSGSSMVLLPAAKLFDSLDKQNEGTVAWEDILDAIITKTKQPLERHTKDWMPIEPNVDIHSASHCKREFIVKIVPLRTKVTFCYAVVSKLGRVGVYDGEFNLLDTYKIGLKPSAGSKEFLTGEQEDRQRRSVTTWVTDAVFVPDSYAIFFSASDRSLHLYDATGLIHVPLSLVGGIKNTPTCLDYYSSGDRTKPSFLFFGDDQGDVTIMKFHQPKKSLFRKKDPDKLDKFLWGELKDQPDYVTIQAHRKVHGEGVVQISYSPETKTILTCSNDPTATMVLLHIEKRRQPYVFKVPRGIKCFHLDKSLHIIVTGSKDGLVRVWNRVVTKQPIISLHGHRAPIVDVRILKHLSAIISLSERGVVKIWNLNDYYCEMSLQLNFPILQTKAKIDFGTRSIFPGPTVSNVFDELAISDSRDTSKINSFTDDIETWLVTRDFDLRNDEWKRNSLVVVCCNFIALLKLNPLPAELKNEADTLPLLRKYKLLPPPSKELYASVPSPWKVADSFSRTPPEESDDASIATKSSSSSSTKNMAFSRGFKNIHTIADDPVKAPMKNLNAKRTQLRIKQGQMKMLVEHCAPHLALDLYDLAPVKFSRPLPVTRRMLEKGVDVSDPEHLLRGKLQKDSTVTTGDHLSDGLSPRSSKNSKLAAAKLKSQFAKGRHTPEWFSNRVKTSLGNSPESSESSSKLTE